MKVSITEEQELEIIQYYRNEHSIHETGAHFHIGERRVNKILIKHQAKRTKEEDIAMWKKHIAQTNLERYGAENAFASEIIKNKIKKYNHEKYGCDNYTESQQWKDHHKANCIKKYGTTSYTQTAEFKEKALKAMQERYGVNNYTQTEEYPQKSHDAKKKNHTFTTSQPEEDFYNKLLEKFSVDDVIRQYREERYPFNCDFYIKSLDTFIELNINWTHGKHKFDANNKNDIEVLNNWVEKSKYADSTYYNSAIDVWTVRDPLKFQTAVNNKLNYFTFYTADEAISWIDTL